MASVGSLFVDVVPSFRNFRKALNRVAQQTVFFGGLGTAIGGLGAVAAGAVPQLLSLASALAAMAPAAAVAVPAILTFISAMAAVKLATAGVGDAIKAVAEGDAKKLAEAMAKLSPNARQFVGTIQSIWPALKRMQQGVQDAFFSGLGPALRNVSANLLPNVHSGLRSLAVQLNAVIRGTAIWLSYGKTRSLFADMFDNIRKGFAAITNTIPGLVSSFFQIGNAASGPLVGAMRTVASYINDFSAKINQLYESGQLRDMISGALAALGQFLSMLGTVAAVFGDVVKAASTVGPGLGPAMTALQELKAITSSVVGQQGMAQFFQGLAVAGRAVGVALGELVVNVFPMVGQALMQIAPAAAALFRELGPVLGEVIGQVGPIIASLGTGIAQGVAGLGPAIAPLGQALATVARVAGPMIATVGQQLGKALATLAPAIAPIGTLLVRAFGAVAPILAPVAALIVAIAQPLASALLPVMSAIQPVMGQFAAAMGRLAVAAAPVAAQLGALLARALISLVPIAMQVLESLTPLAVMLLSAFAPILSSLGPLVSALGRILQAVLVPAIFLLSGALGPVIQTLIGALAPVIRVVATALTWVANTVAGILAPAMFVLGAVLAVQVARWIALNAVMLIARLRMLAYGVIIAVIRGATIAWTAIQWLLNLALNANPVGVVILAIAALVAGVIFAYNKFDWFRNAVNTALSAIGTAASWLWNTVLKPVFTAIGTVATWLWNTILKPVFAAIWLAARFLFTVIVVGLLLPWRLAFLALAPVVMWIWNTILKPIFGLIGTSAVVLWNGIIKPAWNAWMGYFHVIAGVALWLWNTVLKPVFQGLGLMFQFVWLRFVKPVFDGIRFAINIVAFAFRWWWAQISYYWNQFQIAFSLGWAIIKARVFNPIVNFVTVTIPNAWQRGVEMIKTAWEKLKTVARTPVKWVVDFVYNKGIVPLWNAIGPKVGLDKLAVLKFATGGVIPGYTPGRDTRMAAVSGGEAVMRPEWTRAVGPSYVHQMNAAARAGGVQGVRSQLAFADGGIVPGRQAGGPWDVIASAGRKVREVVAGGIWALAAPLVNAARKGLNAIPFNNTDLGGKLIKGVPLKILQGIEDLFKSKDAEATALFGGIPTLGSGPAWQNIVRFAAGAGVPVRLTSGLRRGDPGHHGSGLAADMISPGRGAAGMAQIARFFYQFAPHLLELIHSTGGGFFVKNGRKVGGGFYGHEVANHYDHVHVAATNAGLQAALKKFGGGGGNPSGNRALGRAMMGQFGFGPSQWPALERLWTKESGWNHRAKNPSSGAYGIPQSLPASKMRSAGADYLTNPATQIRWGLGYIKGRYGSPAAALAFHNRNNWYDDGGVLPPGMTPVLNGTGGPEAVLTKQQWVTMQKAAQPQQQGGYFEGQLVLDSGELLGVVRGEIRRVSESEADSAYYALRGIS